jgi:hypothetical protein
MRTFVAGGADKIVFNDAARLYPFSHRHTVAGWAYRTSDPVATYRFAQESDASGATRWYLAPNNNGSQGAPGWRYYVFASGGVYMDSWCFAWPPLNVWSHVAVSHDTSTIGNQPVCYVNGAVVATSRFDNWSAAMATSDSTLRLGNSNAGGNGWPGSAQNLANWSDILSLAEIQALARGVSPHRIRTGKLLWHYPMFPTTEEGDWAGGRAGERVGTTVAPGQLPSGPMIVV